MSRTFPGNEFVPRYRPSLAITRTGINQQKRIYEMSIDVNYHQSVNCSRTNAESEQAEAGGVFTIQKPVPPINSPRMDSTNRPHRRRRNFQVNSRIPHSVVNPRSMHDIRTGFWKTATRPTPGEMSLKYHKVRDEKHFHGDINHQNMKDPDVLSTEFVLSLLERRLGEEQPKILPSADSLDDSYLPGNFQNNGKNNNFVQRKESSGSLFDHKQRLQAIRSHDSYHNMTETGLDDLNPQEDQQMALRRLAQRFSSPTFLHKHTKTFCGECIPDMASSHLLNALDSYRNTNSRTNQLVASKLEAEHFNTSSNDISKLNAHKEKSLQPEILVKFEDGPDSLKTIRLPESLPLPKPKNRKPNALLKLSLRQSKRSATETSLFADKEIEKRDDNYPGFFTFSTAVRTVRTPANTPVPSEIENYDNSHSTSLPKQTKSHVVKVATHGKGALIIQHHKHFNAAKLDVFLPQVKMGK